MRRILSGILHAVLSLPRKWFYRKKRKPLTNITPTIIASDCVGGIIYHNLGLKFQSPTINLFFGRDDFLLFVENLQGYLTAELMEERDNTVAYPVGSLEYEGKKIRVNFMHYSDFQTAKEKWDARKKRVDFSNLCVIQIAQQATPEYVERFDMLPYHKMLISGYNPTNSKNVVTHPILRKTRYQPGEILRYKSKISICKHIDDIDYVSFLNSTIQ